MKKYFLLSVAAVGLMFGCQKKELSNGNESINNEGPVQVKMNIDVPSAVIPATKGTGSVDKWGSQKLTLLAYKVGADWTKPENSLFTKPIETNAPTTDNYVLVQQEVDGEQLPVYYKDNDAYDFFGYYLDNLAGALVVAENGASMVLTIDGTQDIMAARTNISEDIARSGKSVAEKDVYSAFSARRNVVPGLIFNHMLARFNFYIVAADQSVIDNRVTVESITIESPTEGTLQVAGSVPNDRSAFFPTFTKKDGSKVAELSLTSPTDNGTMGTLIPKAPYAEFLKKNDIEAFKNDPYNYLLNKENPQAIDARTAAQIGSCVMVMPGEASHDVVVTLKNNEYESLPINPLEFTIKAEEIVPYDGAAPIDKFAAGYQYDVVLMIYGPQQVKVEAYLNEWQDGGWYAHDPETDGNDIIEPKAPVVTFKAATENSLEFAVESPYTVESVWAALKDLKTETYTKWLHVTPTKAWKNSVKFEGLTYGHEYECYLRYGDDLSKEVATGVKAIPSDVTARGAVHVFNSDSYREGIPVDYRVGDNYNGVDKYIALYYDAVDDAKVTVKFNGVDTNVKNADVESTKTLMKFDAKKLFGDDAKVLKYGKYEIIMSKNTSTSSQTVIIKDPKFKFKTLSVVKDKTTYEESLPVIYLENNPYSDDVAETFPWIVAEITDCDTPLVTATLKGAEPKIVEYTYDTDYDILIVKKAALGTSAAGEWTIDINNVVWENPITIE